MYKRNMERINEKPVVAVRVLSSTPLHLLGIMCQNLFLLFLFKHQQPCES